MSWSTFYLSREIFLFFFITFFYLTLAVYTYLYLIYFLSQILLHLSSFFFVSLKKKKIVIPSILFFALSAKTRKFSRTPKPMKIIYNIYRFFVAKALSLLRQLLAFFSCTSLSFITRFWFIGRYFIFHFVALSYPLLKYKLPGPIADMVVVIRTAMPLLFRFSTLNLFLHFACDVCLFCFPGREPGWWWWHLWMVWVDFLKQYFFFSLFLLFS